MHTDMTQAQCEAVLAAGHYGHLGCFDGKDPYVVPVTYLYQKGFLYSFTWEGKKIELMRKHPNVCLQVEQIENGFTWESVIAWGTFELVTDEKSSQAMKVELAHQFGKITLKERKIPVSPMIADLHLRKTGDIDKSLIYRIDISHMTGKAASIE